MAGEDWVSTKLPVLMVQAIDQFLDTDIAKKNGVFSRPDFLTRVVSMWFSDHEKEFGLFVPRNVVKNLKGFDHMKPFD
jgi:hypothetical protein